MRVHPEDLGRVIGRAGRTAKALRTPGHGAGRRPQGARRRGGHRFLEAPSTAKTQLRVARLTKAHGLKGAIKLELYTDEPGAPFRAGRGVHAAGAHGRPGTARRSSSTSSVVQRASRRVLQGRPRPHRRREPGQGHPLGRPRPRGAPSDDDAWYDHQLVGLAVLRDGVAVGNRSAIDHFPAQDLLTVTTPTGEVLVPFVDGRSCPAVDIEAGTLTVDPAARPLRGARADEPTPSSASAPRRARE